MKLNFLHIVSIVFLLLLASCKTADTGSSRDGITIPFPLKEATLVDLRLQEDFNKSPVKNAVNIPLAEIENNFDFFRKQNKTVLFCNTGRQSGEAYDKLRKNGIRNVYNAKTWKNVFSMQNNIYNNLVFSKEKPSTYTVKKTEKSLILAVGLAEETVLKKHITPAPTTLTVLKGKILFNINNEDYTFVEGDVYEIPVNVEHEVTGKGKENVFTLTKEL